jgi:hypothetical protein
MSRRVERDDWPECCDGRKGSLLGRKPNLSKTWTAAAYIIAEKIVDDPRALRLFDRLTFSDIGDTSES